VDHVVHGNVAGRLGREILDLDDILAELVLAGDEGDAKALAVGVSELVAQLDRKSTRLNSSHRL